MNKLLYSLSALVAVALIALLMEAISVVPHYVLEAAPERGSSFYSCGGGRLRASQVSAKRKLSFKLVTRGGRVYD